MKVKNYFLADNGKDKTQELLNADPAYQDFLDEMDKRNLTEKGTENENRTNENLEISEKGRCGTGSGCDHCQD